MHCDIVFLSQFLQAVNIDVARWLSHDYKVRWQNNVMSAENLKRCLRPGVIVLKADFGGNLLIFGASKDGMTRTQQVLLFIYCLLWCFLSLLSLTLSISVFCC